MLSSKSFSKLESKMRSKSQTKWSLSHFYNVNLTSIMKWYSSISAFSPSFSIQHPLSLSSLDTKDEKNALPLTPCRVRKRYAAQHLFLIFFLSPSSRKKRQQQPSISAHCALHLNSPKITHNAHSRRPWQWRGGGVVQCKADRNADKYQY